MDFPELPEDVKRINKQLADNYGQDSISGQAIWRVSWSNDQWEKRLSEYTPEGLQMLHPEVQLLPKYQHVRNRWILERLCLVPDVNIGELPTQKQSYECMYPFENAYTGDALPPSYQAACFVIDCVYAAIGKKGLRKYVDDEAANPIESRAKRIAELQEELFGDESSLLMRTKTGEAVAYTGEPTIQPVKE